MQHPKAKWTDDKTRIHFSIKRLYKQRDQLESEEEEIDGIFINKKLLNRESSKSCPVCSTYSFKSNDDVYMSKFDCCEKCYIQWVEHREERWLKGWRPPNKLTKEEIQQIIKEELEALQEIGDLGVRKRPN